MAKGLAIEALANWPSVLIFLPFVDAVAYFRDLEDVTYVRAVLKSDNKHWEFGYDCMCGFIRCRYLDCLYDAWIL